MSFDALKKIVCDENLRLAASGLVILTEGNVSQISEDRKYFAIKPSGVPYHTLKLDDIVILNIEGEIVEGKLQPSTDTPTHLFIYKNFPNVGGIAHTHSTFATTFAQMRKPIICCGTTHADAFQADIPVTRLLNDHEINHDYELNTGKVIGETLKDTYIHAVLVAHHGPFTFGKSAKEAVNHACILEKVATISMLAKEEVAIPEKLKSKHHERKHGANRYYGQN